MCFGRSWKPLYSGTEPKVRLLIEGRDQGMIERQADRIAEVLKGEIGA